MFKKLLPWFAAFLLLVVVFGTTYITVQQAQRSDANYPQIQIAEDTASSLNRLDDFALPLDGHVDMAKSLAPFTLVYDKHGKLYGGTGYLGDKAPEAPLGILKAAEGKDYHAVTWQPRSDVRIAAVTVAAKNYYVLSGRNLKQVEKNETLTLQLSLLGGLAALVLFCLVFILSDLTADEY
jgi:hypothetical protein